MNGSIYCSSGRVSLKFLLLVFLAGALIPFSIVGWKELYNGFLERNPPQIKITDLPRGVGITPVSISFEVSDSQAGLDEVIVRTRQRNNVRELKREAMEGRKKALINIEFPGEKSLLDEGVAILEIRAFDRALWNNGSEVDVKLKVDYRPPKIEVLTRQHNARQGGSQLIFYKAVDEDLAISGIRIGKKTFQGYPARGLDSEFDDSSLYVALYAIDQNTKPASSDIKVFAEDGAGNVQSSTFFNRVRGWTGRKVKVEISEDFLRGQISRLADRNFEKLQNIAALAGKKLEYQTAKGSVDRLIEKFILVNEDLRSVNENEISALIKTPRFKRYWSGAFLMPQGVVRGSFGDRVTYTYQGTVIGSHRRTGYLFQLPADSREVVAMNDGIVMFSELVGVYGRAVGIDHGFGLVSIYGHLESSSVLAGDQVEAGQVIGVAGKSGFSEGTSLFVQIRVHGVPVDPREWWDKRWHYGHITAKINSIKRMYGITVYRPLF
ncbi:MAG: M23 family metallopeptidase [Candidatus Dadabacteria bacterium]|nr:MAG: M23 family metallopeptidase [Candidatus Dadabacteria bacterium]